MTYTNAAARGHVTREDAGLTSEGVYSLELTRRGTWRLCLRKPATLQRRAALGRVPLSAAKADRKKRPARRA